MNIRESLEVLEESYMSPCVSFSSRTRGRDKSGPLCGMRSEYQGDRDRILHSKVFQRLKHRTQVFLASKGDYYRTRLTHTLEVSQIARIIAKTLRLNESFIETIALGHDLGHIPLDHSGEYILNEICEDGFAHYQQSVHIVEILERDGRGLNLTWGVGDGISNHRTSGHPSTLERAIARLSGKIAYISHDIDDAIRARMFVEDEFLGEYTDILEHSVWECPNDMIYDIILNGMDKLVIIMSEGTGEAMQGLRRWMFENAYKSEIPKAEEGKAQNMTRQSYEYYVDHVGKLPMEYVLLIVNGREKKSRAVCDYIAGTSDIHTIDQSEGLFVPKRQNAY